MGEYHEHAGAYKVGGANKQVSEQGIGGAVSRIDDYSIDV